MVQDFYCLGRRGAPLTKVRMNRGQEDGWIDGCMGGCIDGWVDFIDVHVMYKSREW